MSRKPRRTGALTPEERKARMVRLREARARAKAREVKAATMARALAHPIRVAILEALSGTGSYCRDIVEAIAVPQSTVSQHLKVLKEAGLVTTATFGPSTRYGLSTRGIGDLRLALEPFFADWARSATAYERSVLG